MSNCYNFPKFCHHDDIVVHLRDCQTFGLGFESGPDIDFFWQYIIPHSPLSSQV